MTSVHKPTGLELALNELWLPPSTRTPDANVGEPEPVRPNREQRRRMKKALRRRNDGSAKR